MAYLMGIDLGSTSLKAVVYDFKGRKVSSGSRPTIVSHLEKEHPTWAFWEPDRIWNDTASAIKDAVSQIEHPKEIEGVAVTGFGMDGVPINKRGEWLYPFISWHCPRTEELSRKWSKKVGSKKIFSISGKQILAIDTVYRILWIQENYPHILKETDKWLLIEDFINFMLCGRKATDYSMASCTELLDQQKKDWSDELIKSFGIDRSILPELLQSGTYLGGVTSKASKQTGLSEGTPVILGGHDYICAALAVGAFTGDTVMDITGTWEMVLQSSTKPFLNNDVYEAGLTVDSHVVKDKYCTLGCAVSADMIEWFRANYGFEEKSIAQQTGKTDWDYLIEKAESAPCGSKGVFFLPHFSGAGSPINDNRSLGAFIGLSNSADKGDMLRAIYEGLNYQFKDMLLSLEKALKKESKKIIAVGGATRNNFWMQNKCDIIGKAIEAPNIDEATPLGAALLAGIGVGVYKDEKDAYQKTFRPGKVYEPDEAKFKKYNKYYEIYKSIYPALKGINRKIFNEFRR